MVTIPLIKTSLDIETEYRHVFDRFIIIAVLVVAAMGVTTAAAIMLYQCSVYDINGEGKDITLFLFILSSGCLGGFSVVAIATFVQLNILDRMVKIAKAREVILGSK